MEGDDVVTDHGDNGDDNSHKVDFHELIGEFSGLVNQTRQIIRENETLRNKIGKIKKEIDEAKNSLESLNKVYRDQQSIIDMLQTQQALIPILEATNENNNCEIELLINQINEKELEVTKLKEKHLNDLKGFRAEMEQEKTRTKEDENRKLFELEERYKHAQTTEVTELVMKAERDKQDLIRKLQEMDQLISNEKQDHIEEVEKLKIEIEAVNRENSKSITSTDHITEDMYRKTILAMQNQYEKQIEDLKKSLNQCEPSVTVEEPGDSVNDSPVRYHQPSPGSYPPTPVKDYPSPVRYHPSPTSKKLTPRKVAPVSFSSTSVGSTARKKVTFDDTLYSRDIDTVYSNKDVNNKSKRKMKGTLDEDFWDDLCNNQIPLPQKLGKYPLF